MCSRMRQTEVNGWDFIQLSGNCCQRHSRKPMKLTSVSGLSD